MHPELPPVVTFGQGGMGDVPRELVETFMARQLALRNIGSDAAPRTGSFSDTDLSAAQKAGNRERRPDDLETRPLSDLHVSSQLRSEFSRPE
jgi:hypothetical protein